MASTWSLEMVVVQGLTAISIDSPNSSTSCESRSSRTESLRLGAAASTVMWVRHSKTCPIEMEA
jgi:hypothetical protein